jgi:hypothetical protein
MKVYIITEMDGENPYDGVTIKGVYSDESRAKEIFETLSKDDDLIYNNLQYYELHEEIIE